MKKKFLIVDDSKISRQQLKNYILKMNFEVIHEAQDGIVALERFKQINYDYVLMDLEMPNMKGTEASVAMLEINPNINIVLVTSIMDKQRQKGVLDIGVKKILQKPISFEHFEEVIKALEEQGS